MTKKKHRAVVTGATRGIGFAIAERLLRDSCEVIATGTGEHPGGPDGSIYKQVDFLDEVTVSEFVDMTEWIKK